LIGRIDRDGPGAFGTLMDDVVAGIVTGLLLLTVLYFLPDGVLE
jgi:phosphatidylglycerophosphatase A